MNPVYSPAPTGVPFTNSKGLGYPAGFPVGYAAAAAAPAYTQNIYAGTNPAFTSGYAPGTPFKMSCSPNTGTVPPYSSSPNPYHAAVYPVRSTYPQQNPYAQALIPSQQQGTYYTQPLYAAPPHVIHHTTVVQPNGMPAAMYAPTIPPPRPNGVAMGMVAGTTMAMSADQWFLFWVRSNPRGLVSQAQGFGGGQHTHPTHLIRDDTPSAWPSPKGTLLTTPSPAPVAPHQVTMPTYRPPGTPGYSYVPPQW